MFKKAPQARPRLAADVYDQLLSAVVNGQIKPGERLIQEKIAAQINISRTPVREALLRLEQEGVLEQTGRKGFTIRDITDQEIRALYGAREAVEGYAAYVIATNRGDQQLATIEQAVLAEQQLSERDVEKEFTINRNIHRTIVEQSGNSVLLGMFDSLWSRGVSLWLFSATRDDQTPPKPDVHSKLLQKLKSGTPEEAQKEMIDHIRDGLDMHLENKKMHAGDPDT